MKTLLKHNKTLIKTYWVKREKNKILGWFGGLEYLDQLKIETEGKPDIHFTYPEDGNYHITLNYQNTIENHYLHAYKKQFKIKTINKLTKKKSENEISRDDYPNMLSHFVPTFKNLSLNIYKDKSHVFQFPSKGFSVHENFEINNAHGDTFNKTQKNDDLIIDLEKYENQGVTINICAYLLGKGQPTNYILKEFNYVCDTTEYPHIYMGYRPYRN